MSQANALRRALIECEFGHSFFESHLNELRLRVQDAIDGFPPSADMVVGPSRVGKSMLAKAILRMHPQQNNAGARTAPVLFVPLPPSLSPKQLPRSVLEALGVPVPTAVSSTSIISTRMARQLALAGTRVILFEESSHISDVGSKTPPRAAGDWFKHVVDDCKVSIVLFGVPGLERLLDRNEQLRFRCGAVMRFNPYAWAIAEEQHQFVACMRAFVSIFERHGYRFTCPPEALVKNTYLLSGGLIGIASMFMSRLAMELRRLECTDISFEICALAASRVGGVASLDWPAFSAMDIEPITLQAAHARVLDEANVRFRRRH